MSAYNDVRDKAAFRTRAFRLLRSWGVPENDADLLAFFGDDPDGRDMPGQFAKRIFDYYKSQINEHNSPIAG